MSPPPCPVCNDGSVHVPDWACEAERLNSRVDNLVDRVYALECPTPIGPIAPPLGDHVEALRERKAVAAWLRAFATTDIGVDVAEYIDAIANDIEAGRHHTVKP